MTVTIKDVAALAGVSPSTVSRTCKNNPSISNETKEKVRKAMLELGYEPNFQASNLASQNSRTIGIILPASAREVYENSFFLLIVDVPLCLVSSRFVAAFKKGKSLLIINKINGDW